MSCPPLRYILPVLISSAIACGGDGEPADDINSANISGEEDRNRHGDQDCWNIEFDFDAQRAERDDRLDVLLYTATVGPDDDQDRLTLDFYFSQGAIDGPQSLDFIAESPSDCHTCLQIRKGCSDESCSDGKIFAPIEGRLELDDMGPTGGPLVGELSNTLLGEVVIDPESNEATPVEGGETWCINAHVFDIVVE